MTSGNTATFRGSRHTARTANSGDRPAIYRFIPCCHWIVLSFWYQGILVAYCALAGAPGPVRLPRQTAHIPQSKAAACPAGAG
jgi:hypothetical protein